MEQGYIPKSLSFDDEARQKLITGITTISKAVKSTLGPLGKTVLIESPNHTSGMTVTKDGVTVADSIFLNDPIENLAVRMMKEAASRTAHSAGDGTTTAIVLTEALVKAGQDILKPESNITEVIKYINKHTSQIIKRLEVEAKEVTEERLLDVASISANNDRTIGKIIKDAYTQVGINGMVTVEKSMTAETYADVTNGIKIARGYSSHLFINNQKKDECILEDVKILVCDAEISSILQIENVLKPVINNGDKLLIIAPCSPNVVNTLSANVVRSGLKFCNIQPPQFGYKQHELMQDIAMSVGATYFSEKTGDDLSLIQPSDLGVADKVIVGEHSSVIFKKDNSTPELNDRIAELKIQKKNTKDKASNEFIKERIASLAGSIGCIYVGGNSEMEQKEKYDRVDDSVCAVRSALEEGILAGGGIALFRESISLDPSRKFDEDENSALLILAKALRSPLVQILENAGKNKEKIIDQVFFGKYNYGYDVKNDKYGDMYKMGVIDPLKVTKNALINAVSVATTILSTNAIVTNMRA
jgi:chaperonin GroEL